MLERDVCAGVKCFAPLLAAFQPSTNRRTARQIGRGKLDVRTGGRGQRHWPAAASTRLSSKQCQLVALNSIALVTSI